MIGILASKTRWLPKNPQNYPLNNAKFELYGCRSLRCQFLCNFSRRIQFYNLKFPRTEILASKTRWLPKNLKIILSIIQILNCSDVGLLGINSFVNSPVKSDSEAKNSLTLKFWLQSKMAAKYLS